MRSKSFAGKWCLAFEKSTLGATPEAESSAEIERVSLLEAIQANPGVAQLASNPLLLTILALIKRQGVELPKSRIKLYDRYLETLIEAWNRASALDKSAGRESMVYETTLEVLGPLALRLREENPTAGLVSARQLQDWLTEHYTGEQWGLKPGPAREKRVNFWRVSAPFKSAAGARRGPVRLHPPDLRRSPGGLRAGGRRAGGPAKKPGLYSEIHHRSGLARNDFAERRRHGSDQSPAAGRG